MKRVQTAEKDRDATNLESPTVAASSIPMEA